MADFYFQLKDLAVGYHGNPLIRDINIGIDKGEIVTLIGPNGSGKSTILKSITRQLKLIGGTVFFDDTSLMELSYKELSSTMAVVLTERIKTELMTCHDIVATGRYPYTGRLGILAKRDESWWKKQWRQSMHRNWAAGISMRSAMDSGREFYWRGQSVRSRKS